METHDDRPSSRVKDLVDIIIYAESGDIAGARLRDCLRKEAAARKLVLPAVFSVPEVWMIDCAPAYAKLCAQTGVSKDFFDMKTAIDLAGRLLDPILSDEVVEKTWNHLGLSWMT